MSVCLCFRRQRTKNRHRNMRLCRPRDNWPVFNRAGQSLPYFSSFLQCFTQQIFFDHFKNIISSSHLEYFLCCQSAVSILPLAVVFAVVNVTSRTANADRLHYFIADCFDRRPALFEKQQSRVIEPLFGELRVNICTCHELIGNSMVDFVLAIIELLKLAAEPLEWIYVEVDVFEVSHFGTGNNK